MNNKQILAAIELADHEVRLIVGEFFNTRFNIIKVEKVPCFAVGYDSVIDPQMLTSAIQTALQNVQKMIGAKVNKVLLAIPAYRLKRYSVTSTVAVEGIDGTLTVKNIQEAIAKVEEIEIDPSLVKVQTTCVKYTVNGISTRRIPLGEKCSQVSVDIDLYCADRQFIFDLVGHVEASGLKVLDLFVDGYAIAKEAALFEQSVDQQVVVLKVERSSTSLSLFKNGRFMASTILPYGIGLLVEPIVEQYGLTSKVAVELFKYSVQLNHDKPTEYPIHIWSKQGQTMTLSEKQILDITHENLENWMKAIEKTCTPILQQGSATVIITGEGGETDGLDSLLAKRLNAKVKVYTPETLGARNAGLTACLGLFYAYQDKLPIVGIEEDSIDMQAFVKSVSYREKTEQNKEDTLTNKIKVLFQEGKLK